LLCQRALQAGLVPTGNNAGKCINNFVILEKSVPD
jgi:hypothetical protein